ncbi:MAG: GGDEF domain-containing protein, partial [Deltaproteobacteria bacterium]|nr:GGDEF domain-containing protein [Deltaproteobacteria bacterium]
MSTSIEALASLARELQGSHAFSELLQLVADRCAGLLETSRASIRLLDPGGSKLLAVCRAGSPLHLNPHEELRVGEGLMGWIVEHRQPLHTGDAEADARFVPRAGMRESLGSFVGVPLVAGDATLGVLSATSPERDRFTAAHVELLTLLAGIAAPHIEIARRDFVVRDPLTGLFNHAHFHKTLDGEIERSAVYGLPFSLVLIDIDRFRAVNESYGHGVGDALIKAIAEILVGRRQAPDGGFRLRGQDSAARYGGDELALLLPHTPKSGAAAKGDGLRAYVADYDFACLDLPAQTVS